MMYGFLLEINGKRLENMEKLRWSVVPKTTALVLILDAHNTPQKIEFTEINHFWVHTDPKLQCLND